MNKYPAHIKDIKESDQWYFTQVGKEPKAKKNTRSSQKYISSEHKQEEHGYTNIKINKYNTNNNSNNNNNKIGIIDINTNNRDNNYKVKKMRSINIIPTLNRNLKNQYKQEQ